MVDNPPLVQERRGRIALLRLNRPERLNAVSLPLYEAMETALVSIRDDSTVRAVVLTGTGRAFCAGADLKAHGSGNLTPEARRTYVQTGQRVYRELQNLPKPIVAAVNGHAVGAGLELALSCDFIVAAREAKLRFPELSLGTFVGGGTVYTLAERVGVAKAKELIMVCEFFSGEEAERLGVANVSVPVESVLPESMALAEKLAARAPVPMASAKELLSRARYLEADDALELEVAALLRCMETNDWHEGIAAFDEQRDPKFIGE